MSDQSGHTERCICVDGLGFDSLDPLAARPCPVHSPEYAEVTHRIDGELYNFTPLRAWNEALATKRKNG